MTGATAGTTAGMTPGTPPGTTPWALADGADPTGLSSPLGQVVMVAGLLAAIVVGLRWWWGQRRK
ncbi:hypothetical protein [Streptoalloteichus tenebrarius]|uniref:hypothetical protein n=1 Tax=Streptoalloteichus tenebrarius (strain ATCC 17920 / DSM 40477 / JCM 4838 / CBS 697.72 / NBRC 16177 / NCIMB 11028 / NRRL B-12390 / A12253. 1 / ISP 5477) TaxID=1933 RepID=UPI0020A5CF47|nr:hypothetical protein [Streptoalloteichus tenebrarius]